MDEISEFKVVDIPIWVAHYYEGDNFDEELRDHINARKQAKKCYCTTSNNREDAIDNFMAYVVNQGFNPEEYTINTHMDPKTTIILIIDNDRWIMLDIILTVLNSKVLYPV